MGYEVEDGFTSLLVHETVGGEVIKVQYGNGGFVIYDSVSDDVIKLTNATTAGGIVKNLLAKIK